MKLLKSEHKENGTWYFTNINRAAKYIGVAANYLTYTLGAHRPCKGWSLEWVESDDILSKYINPEK